MAELADSSLASDANLEAYYRFSNGAFTTDSSGNGYTLTNNNTVAEVTGIWGNAASSSTNNTNKYLSVASDLGITNGAFSCTCWIKGNQNIENGYNVWQFIDKEDAGTDVLYEMWYQNNDTPADPFLTASRTRSGVAADTLANYDVNIGTSDWYHVVFTYDATNMRMYINGTLVSGPTASSGNGSVGGNDAFNIHRRANGTNYADLTVEDVGIFSRALTADEVLELYTISQIKKVAGVARADIKELSGVALADIKEVAGVA